MTKLIFTSRYLKDAKPSQKENYVHYIGTRKGVEKIDTSKKHLPATVSQKKLVHQLLQDFPAINMGLGEALMAVRSRFSCAESSDFRLKSAAVFIPIG